MTFGELQPSNAMWMHPGRDCKEVWVHESVALIQQTWRKALTELWAFSKTCLTSRAMVEADMSLTLSLSILRIVWSGGSSTMAYGRLQVVTQRTSSVRNFPLVYVEPCANFLMLSWEAGTSPVQHRICRLRFPVDEDQTARQTDLPWKLKRIECCTEASCFKRTSCTQIYIAESCCQWQFRGASQNAHRCSCLHPISGLAYLRHNQVMYMKKIEHTPRFLKAKVPILFSPHLFLSRFRVVLYFSSFSW